ncbi:MAG: FAD-binding oxidoreductase [Sphingomonadales bacterium]|nr:FAD-binding oxidoreductase [Sphingomonadales bacterium]
MAGVEAGAKAASGDTIADELIAALGADCVFLGDDIPASAISDESASGTQRPLILLRPRSVEAVSQAMKICSRRGQTVVPQGGMTGLAGGACPRATDIALSLDRISGVEAIDPDAMTMTVRAGTILQVAQQAAEAEGLMVPIDLGARGSCQIGGIIATNAGGSNVIRHRMTRENILGFEAVLADGRVLSNLHGMVKNNTGYDLAQLFVGSEGTLGIITRAVMKLKPLPAGRHTALCALADFDAVVRLLQHARSELRDLSAIEVMWGDYFALLQDLEGERLFHPAPPIAVIIESESMEPHKGAAEFEEFLAAMLEQQILSDALIAQSVREAAIFWAVREGDKIYHAMPNLINLDISIDIGRMGRFVLECVEAVKARFPHVRALFYGHAGDGNLHIALDMPEPGNDHLSHELETIIYTKVQQMGGSISAEHGIGTLKRDYLRYSRSPEEIEVMRRIKIALDPQCLLNPGKVV